MKTYNNIIHKIGEFYYTDKNLDVKMRIPKDGDIPRDILMISDKEIESGMLMVIKNSIGITKEGLFSTISKLLGFNHLGERIQRKLNSCLDNLLISAKIKKEDEQYILA